MCLTLSCSAVQVYGAEFHTLPPPEPLNFLRLHHSPLLRAGNLSYFCVLSTLPLHMASESMNMIKPTLSHLVFWAPLPLHHCLRFRCSFTPCQYHVTAILSPCMLCFSFVDPPAWNAHLPLKCLYQNPNKSRNKLKCLILHKCSQISKVSVPYSIWFRKCTCQLQNTTDFQMWKKTFWVNEVIPGFYS